jgi:NAD(P)-dependent dehydrogenase (short-subunit alcohol dehydrogenase family)
MRMDQVQPEIPEEKLLAEAGLTPPGLPGFLCRSPRFSLADMPHPVRLRSTHAQSLSVGASTGIAHVYPPVTQDARAGFVPYGPSRAGSDALCRVMAAGLRGTGVTGNLLLPGGATATGMLPPGAMPAGQGFLEPAVMGPPIVWLASDEAAGVHDERIIAAEFERWLRDRKAAGEAG